MTSCCIFRIGMFRGSLNYCSQQHLEDKQFEDMYICVLGTGCAGLVTATCLAEIGHQVICVDSNFDKVVAMRSIKLPVYEPHLEEMMRVNIDAGRLELTTNLAASVDRSEIIFLCLEIPVLASGESDNNYVDEVAREIGSYFNGEYKIIVDRCTFANGSSERIKRAILNGIMDRLSGSLIVKDPVEEIGSIAGFDVVSNPEFLREGLAVYDIFNPDRIILGSASKKAIDKMRELYQPIIERDRTEDKSLPPISVIATDICSAEKIKYATNAFASLKKMQ
jgi:UDPglucose 6-dehydrogenase